MALEDKMLEIRARYQEIVNQAARLGIDLVGAIDPVGVTCNTGTGCCAGDGKTLDARELVRPGLIDLHGLREEMRE
jgi:hypothetical protein